MTGISGARFAVIADLIDDALRLTYMVRASKQPVTDPTVRASIGGLYAILADLEREELELTAHVLLASIVSLLEEIAVREDMSTLDLMRGNRARLYELFLRLIKPEAG